MNSRSKFHTGISSKIHVFFVGVPRLLIGIALSAWALPHLGHSPAYTEKALKKPQKAAFPNEIGCLSLTVGNLLSKKRVLSITLCSMHQSSPSAVSSSADLLALKLYTGTTLSIISAVGSITGAISESRLYAIGDSSIVDSFTDVE